MTMGASAAFLQDPDWPCKEGLPANAAAAWSGGNPEAKHVGQTAGAASPNWSCQGHKSTSLTCISWGIVHYGGQSLLGMPHDARPPCMPSESCLTAKLAERIPTSFAGT